MGTDPAFFFCRALKHMLAKPAFLSPLAMLAGFWWQTIRGASRVVNDEELAFHRRFQRRRMMGWFGFKRSGPEVTSRAAPVDTSTGSFQDIERVA